MVVTIVYDSYSNKAATPGHGATRWQGLKLDWIEARNRGEQKKVGVVMGENEERGATC
jgi:hypothetical protein